MRNTATLVYRDGCWCAKESDTRSDKPELITWYWPLVRASRQEWADYEGKELYRDSNTCYSLKVPWGWKPFHLPQGGQTKALAVESEPVPRPKRFKQVRWYYGRWQKYDSRKGWMNV